MAKSNIVPLDLGQNKVVDSSEEIWKKIDGYSFYEVSNLGRVKSLQRKTSFIRKNKPHFLIRKEKLLKSHSRFINLTDDRGNSRDLILARLILTAFVRPPQHGEVARHLDDNVRNGKLSNLAWGSYKDNYDDAVRNGEIRGKNKNVCSFLGSKRLNSKLNEDQVVVIRDIYTPGRGPNNIVALAKKFGVSTYTISCIINKINWKHVDG
jgi:hypothetical protein